MFSFEFTGWIEKDGYMQFVLIPDDIYRSFKDQGIRRIRVWFKNMGPIHLALNSKHGQCFLYLSNHNMKEVDLLPFEEVDVRIEEDTSQYQAPEPPEWMELLAQDEEIRHPLRSTY